MAAVCASLLSVRLTTSVVSFASVLESISLSCLQLICRHD